MLKAFDIVSKMQIKADENNQQHKKLGQLTEYQRTGRPKIEKWNRGN